MINVGREPRRAMVIERLFRGKRLMTSPTTRITHPHDPSLVSLCDKLSELAPSLEADDAWPAHQLEECGRCGVFEWFVERELGGQGWSDADVIRGYLRLSTPA